MNDELATVAQQSGLDTNKVQPLLDHFSISFKRATEIAIEAKAIQVTDSSQVGMMTDAKAKRLELRDIRVQVEKHRKHLKEQSLREGRAIDGMANIIKALIVPVEQHLEQQEKYVVIQEQLRVERLLEQRRTELRPYVEDVTVFAHLGLMDEDSFKALLTNSIAAKEAVELANKMAEDARLAKIAEEKLAYEKLQKDNAKLIAAAQKAKLLNAKKLAAERQALSAEREQRETLQRQADELAMERAAATASAEKAKRDAALAPDRDKLLAFAERLQALELPTVDNEGAQALIDETKDYIDRITKNLKMKAKEL